MSNAYTAYVGSDGQISSVITYNSAAPEEGATVEGLTVHNITDAILIDNNIVDMPTFVSRFLWKNSQWTDRGVPATAYYSWNGTAWVINTTYVTAVTRDRRNSYLNGSDWTQMVDSPLTDAKKAEWVTYRQTLRDIMANLPADLDDPDDVVWPTAP
jgi:hypothetical protein|tara:strand:+ start:1704 stop:2171 length:468 start_codon:yes stop_codon:yes gene_type:complete